MYDGSGLDHPTNLATTTEVVDWCHERGVSVEAELGEVGGKDGVHAPGVRTDPAEAAEFVAATGVDALAVAVGSSHAMTTRDAELDHALIARHRRRPCRCRWCSTARRACPMPDWSARSPPA